LLERLADGDRRLRVLLLVDLPLQLGQRYPRLAYCLAGLAERPASLGQGAMPAGTTARKLPDGSSSVSTAAEN
jgi:hypothetical protein